MNPETFFGVSEQPVMPFVPANGNYSTMAVGVNASQPMESSIGKNFTKGTRLFNLKNDPGESKDLAKERPEVLKRM
jgi:hypothetical protein